MDSDENLDHCCGLEGQNLPLRPHMMSGDSNDDAKFLTLTKIPPKVKNLLESAPTYFLDIWSGIHEFDMSK